ncbi:GNAT family N-acetyltransferase [Promicromonospora sp. NPDC060204]|uniref:GNAT family N-acetyltransferase n=1 Tax=Promicromonospora sp. NPDC060204 TaxID=3347071 RepID=UPI00365A0023
MLAKVPEIAGVITVRPAVESDIGDVGNLEAAVFGDDRWSLEMVKATIAHPDTRVFVAEADVDGDPSFTGYCALYFDGTDVDVTTIGVNEGFRRIGAGRAMMNRMLGEARDLGASKVRLNLRPDNSGAKRLYQSLGFRSTGVVKGYYDSDNADAETMELHL